MISVTVVYPFQPGARFDFAYYVEKHIPMVTALLSSHTGYQGVAVERGLRGNKGPADPPSAVLTCRFAFASIDDYLAALSPYADVVRADVGNYTNITPMIQFNEVLSVGADR